MSQDNSAQRAQPDPKSQPVVPAPTSAPDAKPKRQLTRDDILKLPDEATSPERLKIIDAELRESQAARGEVIAGEKMRAVSGETMRAVGDNRRLESMRYVDPIAEARTRERECKRQARKHLAMGDEFIRWAYADEKCRKEAFDAKEFVKASGRDQKEAEGIVNQMLIHKHFMLVGIEGVEDIDDSAEEATNRAFGLIRRLRKQDMIKFTDSGLSRGKQLWWADRTKWLQPFRRVRKPIWVILAVIWMTFSGVVGLFGGIRECWKCVRHPIIYFSDEADGQQGADGVKVVIPAAGPVGTVKPATPTTKS